MNGRVRETKTKRDTDNRRGGIFSFVLKSEEVQNHRYSMLLFARVSTSIIKCEIYEKKSGEMSQLVMQSQAELVIHSSGH